MNNQKEFLGIDYLNETRNNLDDFMFGKRENEVTTNERKEFFPSDEIQQRYTDFTNECYEQEIFMTSEDCQQAFNFGYNGNFRLTSEQEKEALQVINDFYERYKDDYEEEFQLSTSKEILDTLWYVEGFYFIWNK